MSFHRVLSIALVGSLAACGGPTPPSQVRSAPPMTPSVEGVVRAVGGGPLAGISIVAGNVVESASRRTTSDSDGHYALPSLQLAPDALTESVSSDVSSGYVSGSYPVPVPQVPGQIAHVDIHLQPVLTLVDQLEIELTNDDIVYGYERSVPPLLWPAKVLSLKPNLAGPIEIHADWTGDTAIGMWSEDWFGNTFTAYATSAHTVVLPLSGNWQDDRSAPTIAVGVPKSDAGAREPIHVRLSVQPPAQ